MNQETKKNMPYMENLIKKQFDNYSVITYNEVKQLLEFVRKGLWDKDSTKIGDMKNDVSHPKNVPSGLSPTVTRDAGTQIDIK
ncbi:MAG: hypothetical protein ACJAS4_002525 [Bacteriovoracaceae bacterium]|jgi:hypothetical protein